MAYTHTNSKGQVYYLNSKDVTLRNGRKQTIFYFSREAGQGNAVDKLPPGYTVGENTRTGLPFLKKS